MHTLRLTQHSTGEDLMRIKKSCPSCVILYNRVLKKVFFYHRSNDMPQIAIKGIFQDGIIIPTEEVPFRENMNVIIVFTDRYDDDENRYYQNGR